MVKCSTNTGVNTSFTAELLGHQHPSLRFGHGTQSVIVVTTPARLCCVRLTLQQLQPALRVCGRHHAPKFADEHVLYASKQIALVTYMLGELDRIMDYAVRGWLRPEPLPAHVATAQRALKNENRYPQK